MQFRDVSLMRDEIKRIMQLAEVEHADLSDLWRLLFDGAIYPSETAPPPDPSKPTIVISINGSFVDHEGFGNAVYNAMHDIRTRQVMR